MAGIVYYDKIRHWQFLLNIWLCKSVGIDLSVRLLYKLLTWPLHAGQQPDYGCHSCTDKHSLVGFHVNLLTQLHVCEYHWTTCSVPDHCLFIYFVRNCVVCVTDISSGVFDRRPQRPSEQEWREDIARKTTWAIRMCPNTSLAEWLQRVKRSLSNRIHGNDGQTTNERYTQITR